MPAALSACSTLAATGSAPWIVMVALLGLSCLLIGLALILGRGRRSSVVVALALLACTGATLAAPTPARAASCAATPNSVTITQTSTMAGLVPGLAPVPIYGVIVNESDDEAQVSTLAVSIVGVTKANGAPAGSCDASDYTISDPRMTIAQQVAVGGTVGFAGASIGFANSARNQDGCQGAVVELTYVLGP